MKRFFLIFALLIACRDENQHPCRFPVTISDGLPIQFWLSDCQTYNENEVCGIHHKCWCQPWNCDKEIVLQFTDDNEAGSFDLLIQSEEAESEAMAFNKQDFNVEAEVELSFTNPDFDGSLTGWTNRSTAFTISAPSFSYSSGQAVINEVVGGTTEGTSKALSTTRGGGQDWPPGTYRVRIRAANGSGVGGSNDGGDIRIRVYDVDSVIDAALIATFPDLIPNDPGNFYNVECEFEITEAFTFMGFIFDLVNLDGPVPELITQVESIELLSAPTEEMVYGYSVYTTSFVPSELGFCDEQIQLKIIDTAVSPEAEVAKSDCIDLKESHDCTLSIDYGNNRNFAGLIFENTSPATEFSIQVPALFFHERFPEEDNAIELHTGIFKTSGFVKAQRLFETDYMPYYMHRKLKLIFKMQNVTIDNQDWTKEEPYEIQEGDRRWPVKKAKCFLTEKNFVQRVVL